MSAVTAVREPNFLLARHEKRVLTAIARRLPRWILPDDLTALGVAAAIGICLAYQATNADRAWLWVASALLVVHWLGDSLDGTVARVRGIERPRYGYYLDHLVDAISTACIGLGLGLSPFMLLWTGALIVVAYLMLSINVYLESYALGRFLIGYGAHRPHRGPRRADRAEHRPGARRWARLPPGRHRDDRFRRGWPRRCGRDVRADGGPRGCESATPAPR